LERVSSSKELERRLSSLRARKSSFTLWRGVRERRDPLSTRGARLRGGRWSPRGLDALYAALDVVTVRAELARGAARRRMEETAIYPIQLVELKVEARAIDLTTGDRLDALGVAAPFSILTPTNQTQRIGKIAAELGIEALLVPSVVTRGKNAVLFPGNLANEINVVRARRISSPGRWPKQG
jgi:RES domain-containing protein